MTDIVHGISLFPFVTFGCQYEYRRGKLDVPEKVSFAVAKDLGFPTVSPNIGRQLVRENIQEGDAFIRRKMTDEVELTE